MLQKVVTVMLPRVEAFELGVACEVFGVDRRDQGLPAYDFSVVTAIPGAVTTRYGYTVDAPHDLDRIDDADLVIVPAGSDRVDAEFAVCDGRAPGLEPLYAKLRDAHARGAMIASVCSGAFVLGDAGLLDGRRCTTHWMHTAELVERFPAALVDPDVLYVDDDRVLTSAGTAAGIDLCLYIVRREQGSRVANTIARRMVVPPHRDGGQAQYIAMPLVECTDESLAPLLDWVRAHLDREFTVPELARKANMSARTFARRFQAETGTTPARWINDQRVLAAQDLLESSDLPVETIATRVGFSGAAVLRAHFQRLRRTSPQQYRSVFRRSDAADLAREATA
ncbi:AraC family transcriptional regulator [Rhodococcus rhodnii]|nr:helix-turn-helix domain-containing protein [Rhodococcus rhodnii]TXG91316.1 AraC family transcriptional regulator [Rhodococcus rhodnii]